jgi:hypothetical protein
MKADFTGIEIVGWEPVSRGLTTARFDVRFANGLIVKKFSLSADAGRRWLNLPSWTQLDRTTGKRMYHRCIGFDDVNVLIHFKASVLAALDAQIGGDR